MRTTIRTITLAASVVFGLFLLADLAQAADGAAIWKAKCAVCHGEKGEKKAVKTVTEETAAKPPMPKLAPEELKAVVEYAKTLVAK